MGCHTVYTGSSFGFSSDKGLLALEGCLNCNENTARKMTGDIVSPWKTPFWMVNLGVLHVCTNMCCELAIAVLYIVDDAWWNSDML